MFRGSLHRLSSMVNLGELSISIVRCDKPKTLIGLSQNGKQQGYFSRGWEYTVINVADVRDRT
ncbi:MAG: hypothetical protein K2P53_06260 [Rickettsiales bacterium]|nr:hypothetical protein [Rickettsiales bacterium]